LQHLLTYMYSFHYHELCLACCWEWFCQFALVDSTVWLPYLIDLFSIIIIILGISFMQGIYTYIPETNHVPREHCVATILM
jgi:hypothetical protein